MGRRPCCDKVGLKKGPWTTEEDKRLINFILTNGQCCWRALPKLAGLLRCGKSCRLRWTNYLRPDLKRGLLSEYEEQMVIDLHAKLGNRWSKIASHLPGRTDNEIKNHWNTHIKKQLKKMGIDPLTHKPLSDPPQQDHQSSPPTTTNCTKKLPETDHQQPSKDLVETPLNSPLTTTQHIEELSFEGYHPNNTIEKPIDSFIVNEVTLAPPNPTSSFPMSSRPTSSTSSSSSSSGSLLVGFEDLEIPGFDWSLMSNGTEAAGFLWDGDELSNWDLPIGVDSEEINILPEIFSHCAKLDSNDQHETWKL